MQSGRHERVIHTSADVEYAHDLGCDEAVLHARSRRLIRSMRCWRSATRRAGAVQLTAEGRWVVLRAYERRLDVEVRHPVFGYRVSYRRVLDVQARILGSVLVGEIPAYTPMVTR